MRYCYPIRIKRDEDNRFVASSRDIPEALTDGKTRAEAMLAMSEALGAALAGYSLNNQPIPTPSAQKKRENMVAVSPLIAAKLALRTAMKEKAFSNVLLGRMLGLSEGAVRRLMDPDHASRLDGVIQALAVINHQIVVEDMALESG